MTWITRHLTVVALACAASPLATAQPREIRIAHVYSKPDPGRSLLATACADDKADLAVGPTSSGAALAMLPVAAEHRKILLAEPAVADSITGAMPDLYLMREIKPQDMDLPVRNRR